MGAAALPLALIGSSVASGFLSPKPEELESFEGTQVDPLQFLTRAKYFLENALGSAVNVANEPVTLPEPNLSLPSFSGGGLPMPIGTTPKRPQKGLVATARRPFLGEDSDDSGDEDESVRGLRGLSSTLSPTVSSSPESFSDASPFSQGFFAPPPPPQGQSLFEPRRARGLDTRTRSAANLLLQAAQGGGA